MNPVWKIYKSKVMKTLNPEYEEEMAEEVSEVENDVSPIQEDEGPNAVSQLAKKMQGAGTKSWNRLSSLFNKEDEHQLLEETESPPVADHPLAVKPEEPPRPNRRSGFWDSFAANWAAKKQAEAAAAAAANEEAAGAQAEGGATEVSAEERQDGQDGQVADAEATQGGERSGNSFSKYVTLGGGNEEASFKWNFVTSKLAELKTKSMTKTN
uniref:Testis development related protein n=1 Tax=Oryzias latipes TaxID=8090 RepID=A0A3P9H5D7_ORYLA